MFKRHLLARAVVASLTVGAVGAAYTPYAFAQSAEGSINGAAKPDATVTIVNTETGQSRTAKADRAGNFVFSKLVPGNYKVTAGGVTKEVFVSVGTSSQISLDEAPVELERVEVVSNRVRTIDLNSVESSTVFNARALRQLPIARTPDAVSLLAPGVVKGDPGLGSGSLPSFGGASVAENGYYVNGFDVTNIRNFLSYAQLPFDAIDQQQVKSGGYGAEYGRSLGGVVSILTKRGTNQWKGGASVYWTPDPLRSDGQNVVNRDTTTIDPISKQPAYQVFAKARKEDNLNYNAYLGGPIIKDTLFVYGLLEGRRNTVDSFGQDRSTVSSSERPRGMIKVDFQATDNHLFEFTGIDNHTDEKIVDYKRTLGGPDDGPNWYATSHIGTPSDSTITSGGTVMIGKYTGILTDSLILSALAGEVKYQNPKTTGARLEGSDCPTVFEVGATKALGCWNGIFPGSPGRDPKAPETDDDVRKALRVDLEYTLGEHTIRAGLDNQKFTSTQAGGSAYSGGAYWRYYVSTGKINGVDVPAGTPLVRKRTYLSTSGSYEVENNAWYVEDSWRLKDFLIYGGLRGESFDNRNGDGVSFVKAKNLLAPRAGFSWNMAGDGTQKLFGTYGRYFIPVASNTNIRATRAEGSSESWYTYNGRDPRTGAPLQTTQVGGIIGTERIQLPDPATVADTKLRPMNQDEFILGFQSAITKEITVGVKGVYRQINDGMDDFCGAYAIKNWARENGYPNYSAVDVASCVLLNPGRDLNLKVDVNNDGKLQEVTIPAKYLGLEAYKRTYKGLELTLERPFTGVWGGSFSYVWSQSKGTAEGYVQSTLQQEDAGITQDFDFGSFSHGSDGFLPNDRTHVFKFFGNFGVSDEIKLGATGILSSGRPKSCIGFVPTTVADFPKVDGHAGSGDYNSASSYYCLGDDGRTRLTQRGSAGRTPWTYTLDMQVAYSPKIGYGKLTLQANVFNVFNTQIGTRYNEVRDYSRADSNNQPGKLNPNYDVATTFQTPRSVQLSARYEF